MIMWLWQYIIIFGDKPLIHKIYKEGFSTKGKGRGLGLYTVKIL